MNFLTPLAFLLALTIPIIIAMYLLKLRRVEQTVASTYLWQRMVRDVEANAPWQKLRRNLLLLLQLIVALLLMLALARPFTWASGPTGATVVLILDHSLSMAATDVDPNRPELNRLATAKAQINQWIDSLPAATSVTLIAAGETPKVAVASTQDRRLLKNGLNNISITPKPSNLNAALTLASAIANQNPDVAIQLYSDFSGQTDTLRSAQNINISTVVVGSTDQNQAISNLTLETQDDKSKGFVQVSNFSDQPATRRVLISTQSLDQADEARQLINVVDLEIAPRSTESIVLDSLSADVQLLHAQFTEPDPLALDDQAWAIAQNQTPTNILLISLGNRFLQTALALLPNVDITTQRPTDFESSTEQPQYALTIFDSYVPITATLPSTNLFFIGPTRSTPFFDISGSIEQPTLEKTIEADPRLSNLSISDINVLNATRITVPDWATTLIHDATSESPILFAGQAIDQENDQRVATLAFDIRNSDLPLNVAFPLLLANMIDWLGGGSISIPTQVAYGDTFSFVPPPSVRSVDLFGPNGVTERLIPEAGRVTIGPTQSAGLYTLSWAGPSGDRPATDQSADVTGTDSTKRANFVVNAYTPAEADIAPNPVAAATLDSAANPDGINGPASASTSLQTNSQPSQSPREWWRLVALAALIMLMVEWLVYHRGTLARLVNSTE